jgi:hypothetical protein
MKKINYLIFMVLLIATALYAQADRNGTAGASELLISVGARGVAMGGATVTSASGIDAMYWNPANVAKGNNGFELVASHRTFIADLAIVYGAISVKTGALGSFGFSIKSLSMDPILKTTVINPDGTGQTFKPQHIVVSANWSKLLTDKISVGVNAKYVSETIDLVSASGLAFDFGVNYADLADIDGLDFAVVLRNFGGDMAFDGSALWTKAENTDQRRGSQWYKIDAAEFSLPTAFDIALGYELGLGETSALNFAAVYTNSNFYAEEYKFGIEYGYDNLFFVRGGYIHTAGFESSDVVLKLSFGAGLNYNFGGLNVKFDYAYVPAEYFSDTHLISIGLGL